MGREVQRLPIEISDCLVRDPLLYPIGSHQVRRDVYITRHEQTEKWSKAKHFSAFAAHDGHPYTRKAANEDDENREFG